MNDPGRDSAIIAQIIRRHLKHMSDDEQEALAALTRLSAEARVGQYREALAIAHKFAGDVALWAGRPEIPVDADWVVVMQEAERVKESLRATLALSGEAGSIEPFASWATRRAQQIQKAAGVPNE